MFGLCVHCNAFQLLKPRIAKQMSHKVKNLFGVVEDHLKVVCTKDLRAPSLKAHEKIKARHNLIVLDGNSSFEFNNKTGLPITGITLATRSFW